MNNNLTSGIEIYFRGKRKTYTEIRLFIYSLFINV